MEIFLQHKSSWLESVSSRNIYKKNNQVNLLSRDGQTSSVPVQFLIASSPLLQSILTPFCSCESSTASSISLPSATNSTLKLLSQILCKGETKESGGLETTMTNLRELQDVLVLLGLDVKICPKLSYSNRDKECVHPGFAVVKDEVLVSEDTFEEVNGRPTGKQTKKKAAVAKKSSTSVKFKQSGLLKDFRVDLVDGRDNNDDEGQKLEKFGNKCNICDAVFAKFPGLKRHYRENHGIQDETSRSVVVNQSDNKCPKCNSKFRFRGSLLRHFRRKHKNNKHGRKHENNNVQNPYFEDKHSDFTNVLTNQEFDHNSKEAKAGLETEVKSVVTPKRFKCSDCEETFKTRSNLRGHKGKFHEGKTYGCGDCDLICGYRSSIFKHCNAKGHNKNLIYTIVDFP